MIARYGIKKFSTLALTNLTRLISIRLIIDYLIHTLRNINISKFLIYIPKPLFRYFLKRVVVINIQLYSFIIRHTYTPYIIHIYIYIYIYIYIHRRRRLIPLQHINSNNIKFNDGSRVTFETWRTISVCSSHFIAPLGSSSRIKTASFRTAPISIQRIE